MRWWKALPACALPGINPPVTTCSSSVEVRFQFSSRHPGGCQFTYVDGSTRFVSETVDVQLLQSLCTRIGGEVVGDY